MIRIFPSLASRRQRAAGLRLAACVLIVTGCGGKKEAERPVGGSIAAGGWKTQAWPMTRGGRELQGRVHDLVPRQPVVEWAFAAKGAVASEVAVSNGLMVFGTGEGAVVAVDLATRKERWRVETQDAVEATPAIASNRVFVGSNDGTFRALDMVAGKELWRLKGQDKFPTGGVVVASPDGAEEWILVNGYDGVAHCLRAKDGSEVWKYASDNYINGSPAVLDGGLVAFGGCDARVHVIRLADGSAVNQVASDAQIIRSLAGWGDTVYGVNYANQLVACAARADKPAWVLDNDGSQFLTSPALDEARVYAGSRDKALHAVERLSGKRAWQFKTGGRVESAPLVFDDAVVFGSSDGRLYALDPQDGREIWQLDLGENLANAPAFAAGRIVIGGGEGTVFVIRGGENK
ncbi:MAG: PQQ-binding-like beta-propeller repeat protein [Verrucomicrobiota bacterium]